MRFSLLVPAFALLLLASACGDSKEDNQVTETRMDNLDSLEGTISDDMINTDESTDGTPVEAISPDSEPGATADAAKGSASESNAAGTAKTEASSASK
ncbi:hypothetical protein [Sphingorhabdus sp.]|uniref:hypothetical protein n=1 Tax=Sphingorhabdus sp. TaxID=1902408 RepID=UPI00391CCB28